MRIEIINFMLYSIAVDPFVSPLPLISTFEETPRGAQVHSIENLAPGQRSAVEALMLDGSKFPVGSPVHTLFLKVSTVEVVSLLRLLLDD
jgi:hypothetical protein